MKTKILAFALALIMVFSVVSVFASAAFETPTSTGVSSVISDNSGVLYYYLDKTGATMSGALDSPAWTDGNNNGSTKNVITIYDGENGTAGTVFSAGTHTLVVGGVSYGKGGTAIKNQTNIFQNATDPVTETSAVAIKKYNASAYMLNCGLVQGVEYWVTKSGNTFTVVDAGTENSYKLLVSGIDEGNNCNNRNLESKSDDLAHDFMTHRIIVSLTFRWSGETSIDRLIEPCSAGPGFCNQSKVYVDSNGVLFADGGSKAVAQLTSDRYYNLQAEYYVLKDTGAETYSVYYDLYLDGFCVAKQLVMKQIKNKTEAQLTSDVKDDGGYGFRYFVVPGVTANANKPDVQKEYIDAIYLRNLYVYKVANTYTNTNVVNSGNTIEGYDLTLGSNLELNYYINPTTNMKSDADAKVQFTIGEEVVATKKVSEVTADANGLYKFTCPVNSTQMAEDIKVSIVSETREYKIFMNGAATDEYAYSVAQYAKTILDSSDAKYTEAKPVVKAMLNYGAAAQTYFAAKNSTTVGTLANVGYEFTAAELGAADFGTGTVTGATEGMTATLTLDTDTVIKIYKDGALVGTSEGITADKLNDDVTITVDGGSVKVSVLTVAGKVPAAKTEFRALAQALALYSAATEAYIAD